MAATHKPFGRIAQLDERNTTDVKVVGSNPSVVSKLECIMMLSGIGFRYYDPEQGKLITKIGKELMAELNISRRIRIDLMTPAELAITNAMHEVEKAGASIELTNAVIKLMEARNLVADHVDRELNKLK